MKKRIISLFTAFVLIFTMLPFEAFAVGTSSYFTVLKIGLETLESSSINITLNGDYTVNGQTVPSGSAIKLEINFASKKIKYANSEYYELLFEPLKSGNTIKIGSTNSYLGDILFKADTSKSTIIPIESIDMENYLKGVLGKEMNDSYPIEALKAQAVASRSFAISNLGAHSSRGYDLCDTQHHQVYEGYKPEKKNVISAVNSTKGELLVYGGQVVKAFFSSSNGGYTEACENVWVQSLDYFKAKPDSFDQNLWPNGDRVFSTLDIDQKLKDLKSRISSLGLDSTDTFLSIDLNSIQFFESGRIKSLDIIYKDSTGTEKRKTYTKESARIFLGLPSQLYTVSYDAPNDKYTFKGKGYGHGIGLSQRGAQARGSVQNYREILAFYYDGASINSALPVLNQVTLTSASVSVGEQVGISAASTGGSGNGYLYKYVIRKGTNVLYDSGYIPDSSLNYTPLEGGEYTVDVYMKDNLSGNDYDDCRTVTFNSVEALSISGVSVTPGDIYEKILPVNISVTTNSALSDNVLYSFEVLKDGKLVQQQSYGTPSSFSFTPGTSGSYSVKSYVKYKFSSKSYNDMRQIDLTVKPEPNSWTAPNGIQVERIYGSTRYETAVGLSREGWPQGAKNVVIATGEAYPDALASAPLAKLLDAPVLLTTKSSLSSGVIEEIKRLGATDAYIVGAEGAVSRNVEDQLKQSGITSIKRFSGRDRYETAVKIAEEIYRRTGKITEIAVATGQDYPDAISIASFAANRGMPVLLTYNNILPQSVKDFLKGKNVSNTYVIGGTGVVSEAVRKELPNTLRLGGATRYETNYLIINKFMGDTDRVFVVTGVNYPDAITSSAFAAVGGSPVILTNGTMNVNTEQLIISKLSNIKYINLLGSNSIVSATTINNLTR